MTYNEHGKRIRSENLAGRIATKVAQGEGGLGLRTDMAYTVKHIQRGLTLLANYKILTEIHAYSLPSHTDNTSSHNAV